jgi:hypothetical protein
MKNPAMHQVLEKAPEKHAAQKSQYHPDQGDLQLHIAIIKEIRNDRKVDAPDHQRMSLGEHLYILILEQLRLPFIMDFLEFHDSSIISKNTNNRSNGMPKIFLYFGVLENGPVRL